LLTALQRGQSQKVRQVITELGREYPAAALVNNVFRPLRARLNPGDHRLRTLRSLFDGLVIEHAVMCMNAARKRPGVRAALLGWGAIDTTELWLEAIVRCEEGMQVEVLPGHLEDPHLENVLCDEVYLWAEGKLTQIQRLRMAQWVDQGLTIYLLGSASVLLAAETGSHEEAEICAVADDETVVPIHKFKEK